MKVMVEMTGSCDARAQQGEEMEARMRSNGVEDKVKARYMHRALCFSGHEVTREVNTVRLVG